MGNRTRRASANDINGHGQTAPIEKGNGSQGMINPLGMHQPARYCYPKRGRDCFNP